MHASSRIDACAQHIKNKLFPESDIEALRYNNNKS